MVENLSFWGNKRDTYVLSSEYLYYPRKIVVNYSGNRTIYFNGQTPYMSFFNRISEPFTMLLSGEQEIKHYALNDRKEWLDLLKGRSLYVDFGVAYNTKLLGQLFGIKDTVLFSYVPSVREFILVPGDNISNDIAFYLKDYRTGNISKFLISYDRKPLIDLLEQYAAHKSPRHTFSFEIGLDLDITANGGQTNKVILSSDILLPLERQISKVIQSHNPINFESEYTINEILDAFNYSPSTIRKYTETDNTLVYVENHSRLKISPDGLIEYNAVEPGRGLTLPKSTSVSQTSTSTLYESLITAMDFINKVGTVKEDIYVSGDILDNQTRPGRYKFTFDYFYNGLPVIINPDTKDVRHAVEVEIVDGTLNSYRQYIRKYESLDEVEINVPITQVLDEVFTMRKTHNEPIRIENMFLTYMEKGIGLMQYPEWAIMIENNEQIFTVEAVRN